MEEGRGLILLMLMGSAAKGRCTSGKPPLSSFKRSLSPWMVRCLTIRSTSGGSWPLSFASVRSQVVTGWR